MIEGTVNAAYQAVVGLSLRGPTGRFREVDAVVDTGFDLFLSIPPALVSELELPFAGYNRFVLADGSVTRLNSYLVTVLWDDQPRYIRAYLSGADPLVGMALLAGHRLCVDVEPGGAATIEARG